MIQKGISLCNETFLCSSNESFLDFEKLKPFALHLDINPDTLQNELNVLSNIRVVTHEQAFPNVVLMVQGAMTIPVTSATCERSFSKMKTIKISLRNTMSNVR